MAVVMLMLIVGGIGLTQAVSDPNQVTLRWLRLGGGRGIVPVGGGLNRGHDGG